MNPNFWRLTGRLRAASSEFTTGSVKYRADTPPDLDNWVHQPPRPTNASRELPKRSKGSFTGSIVDPIENREKVYESRSLERGLLCILMASPEVFEIHDQPKPVTYVTPEGRRHQHTFDYLAVFRDGRQIAYAVKPEDKVERSGIKTTLALIRDQSLAGFADDALLRTEREISRRAVHNAETLLWARNRRNRQDVEHAAKRVARLGGRVRLRDLVQAIDLGPRGRVAVICLLDEKVLGAEDGTWIGDETLLFKISSNKRAA